MYTDYEIEILHDEILENGIKQKFDCITTVFVNGGYSQHYYKYLAVQLIRFASYLNDKEREKKIYNYIKRRASGAITAVINRGLNNEIL